MKRVIDKLAWTPLQNRGVLFARTKGQELFTVREGSAKKKKVTNKHLLVKSKKKQE